MFVDLPIYRRIYLGRLQKRFNPNTYLFSGGAFKQGDSSIVEPH